MNMAAVGELPEVVDSKRAADAELRKRLAAQSGIPGVVAQPPPLSQDPQAAPAAAPMAAAPPSPPQSDPGEQMSRNLANATGQYLEQSKQVQEALTKSGQARESLVRPALDSVARQASSPQPPAPTIGKEPPLPEAKPRPFLSPEGATALQTVVAGIGSLVTSLAGLSAPVGALHALTGAMNGWAEGDSARVANEWQKYEAAVSKLHRDNATAMQEWDRARIQRSDDTGAAQALLQAKLAEAGLSDYAAQVAEKGFDRMGAIVGMAQQQLHNYQTYENKVLRDLLGAERFAETKRHHAVTETQNWARPTVTEVVDPNDPTRTIKIDARTNKTIGQGMHSIEYETHKKTEKDFATGKQGNTVRSFNTALNHLETLKELAQALNSGDVRIINQLKGKLGRELGATGPVAFEAGTQIVGDEVVKAIIGSGTAGAVFDREKAEQAWKMSNSPAQFMSVYGTIKELMAGQLSELQRQYEAGGGTKDFNKDFLSPVARTFLQSRGAGATSTQYPTATGPNGAKMIFKDGQWQPLK